MTRSTALLIVAAVAYVGLAVTAYLLAPLFGPTTDSASLRATRDELDVRVVLQTQLAETNVRRLDDATTRYYYELTGQGGTGFAGRGIESIYLERLRDAAEAEVSASKADLDQAVANRTDVDQRLRDNGALAMVWSVAAGVLGLLALLLGGVAARRCHVAAEVNRFVLGVDKADDFAEALHEFRAVRASMTRRQRWRHRCSLPIMWCYAAFRAWSEPVRALSRQVPRG